MTPIIPVTTTVQTTTASHQPITLGKPITNLVTVGEVEGTENIGKGGFGGTIINFNPILSNSLEGITANSETHPGWQSHSNDILHYQGHSTPNTGRQPNFLAGQNDTKENYDYEIDDGSGYHIIDDDGMLPTTGIYDDTVDVVTKKLAKMVEKVF